MWDMGLTDISFSAGKPRPTTPLDAIKFICKDLWTLVFRKQIDNLKTNHRGIFVLTDLRFQPLSRMSIDRKGGPKAAEDALNRAQAVCAVVPEHQLSTTTDDARCSSCTSRAVSLEALWLHWAWKSLLMLRLLHYQEPRSRLRPRARRRESAFDERLLLTRRWVQRRKVFHA